MSKIPLSGFNSLWADRIAAADTARKPFMETAKICSQFYSGAVGFMWSEDFRNKYLGSIDAPRFQITIAKAFELVSVIGPTLMFDYPGRVVKPLKTVELDPAGFGDPNDPNVQQAYQQYMYQTQMERGVNQNRCRLMEAYLNYAQREQPGGGLLVDSHMAIVEALVKGRGTLWCETYNYPGTEEVLTGSFYGSVDDLYIDPDCRRSNLTDAKWIARKHIDPYWEVERRFGWAEGSLKKYTSAESTDGVASQSKPSDTMWRKVGKTADLIVWYEVFSKCGVGTRLKSQMLRQYHDAFEETVGDYAYLAIVKGMPCPLNLSDHFMETATPEDVRRQLDWPVPFYRDGRWPVSLLDFYPQPNDPWPLAPLAMGLGELIFMNTMLSSLCDRIYRHGLDKTAILKEACDDAVAKIKSYSHEVIELNSHVAKNINELVTVLERPPVPYDSFRILDYVSSMFDKRTGLMELLYGLNQGGKVTRTAADANLKGEAVSVRPEWMRTRVEGWQTNCANLERIAAGWNVQGQSLKVLLGEAGAQMWDELIAMEDPTVFVREMRSTVEAGSIKRPNKARDNDNIQALAGYVFPLYQSYFQMTGNPDPVNGFIKTVGEAIDQDVTDWMLPPPPPPPEPDPAQIEAQQKQQMAQELAMQEMAAKLDNKRMRNDKLAHELLTMGAGLPPEAINQVIPLSQEEMQ